MGETILNKYAESVGIGLTKDPIERFNELVKYESGSDKNPNNSDNEDTTSEE